MYVIMHYIFFGQLQKLLLKRSCLSIVRSRRKLERIPKELLARFLFASHPSQQCESINGRRVATRDRNDVIIFFFRHA